MSSHLDLLMSSLNSIDSAVATLRLVSDAVGVMIVTLEQDKESNCDVEPWMILWSTRRCDRDFGYLPGELQGKHLSILIPDRFKEVHTLHTKGFSDNPITKQMGETGKALPGKKRDGTDHLITLALNPDMYCVGDLRARVTVAEILSTQGGTGGGRCPVQHA